MSSLPPGLYDQLVTTAIKRRLDAAPPGNEIVCDAIDAGYAHEYLARAIRETLWPLLRSLGGEDEDRVAKEVALYNQIIELVSSLADRRIEDEVIADPPRVLKEITATVLGSKRRPQPIVPLATSALLVNDDEGVSAASVLKRELASSDSVDLICAFVSFTGVRILEDEIKSVCHRGGLRLITTTYMGATQKRALDALIEWGCKVKVVYEVPPANTKLHAKAWMFRRLTGFDTAMVGSSNLSHSALMDGLEWNVRLSRVDTAHILDKFQGTFERYWNDSAFEDYDPSRDGQKLDHALQVCGGRGDAPLPSFFLDVRPLPHQVDILEALDADRARGNNKSLIVAATGTGKTIAAALDYARQRVRGADPALLFVAHRSEILQQSLAAFRAVMRNAAFGELWVAGERPSVGRHVFASIQSLHDAALAQIPPEHFEFVIVDEFHHAEAATYRRLLRHIRPRLLVGLTATPERTDGTNVMDFFGGRAAVELRLWDALEDGLLCPFQYFGISDGTDLSQIRWQRGRYADADLDRMYIEQGRERLGIVMRAIERYIPDALRMRAIGFCVSVRHAEYMAERFGAVGIPACSVTSETPSTDRREAIQRLKRGEVNILFTVDLFNEGVDIPEVDTLLFLRPTESATVFLQQLGRGLRLWTGKPCATVLDFVGLQHEKFRFDLRYRAITGASRAKLKREVEQGFTALPAGCHIELDRVARESVLRNLKAALPTRTDQLVAELRALSSGDQAYPLATFVREVGIDVCDLYRRDRWYSSLKRDAGLVPPSVSTGDGKYGRGVHRLLHIDDPDRATTTANILRSSSPPDVSLLTVREQRMLYMLIYTLQSRGTRSELQDDVNRLWELSPLRWELVELLELLAASAPLGPQPLRPSCLADIPILAHSTYTQDEVMTAFGMENPSAMRQGVKFFEEYDTDVLFVTLKKTAEAYSVTTRYDDRPISPHEFHWESQNSTSLSSPTGQRYVSHASLGSPILLFVREERDFDGRTSPYFCCGQIDYVSHESERPMRITWRLRLPIPHSRFLRMRAAIS